ncbi:uncharacterized protein LOC111829452 [Capsella rubella]|uniref:uncharacterized protein LOC111829452 n=1 Tax=Capsella rubella TaxID=81985 RepID=UPI000CD519C7|nr:uncharacterized protein LOC111829452 [Capsella rubella]
MNKQLILNNFFSSQILPPCFTFDLVQYFDIEDGEHGDDHSRSLDGGDPLGSISKQNLFSEFLNFKKAYEILAGVPPTHPTSEDMQWRSPSEPSKKPRQTLLEYKSYSPHVRGHASELSLGICQMVGGSRVVVTSGDRR